MIVSRITEDRDFYYVEVREDGHRVAFLTIERHLAPLVAAHLHAYLSGEDDANVHIRLRGLSDD